MQDGRPATGLDFQAVSANNSVDRTTPHWFAMNKLPIQSIQSLMQGTLNSKAQEACWRPSVDIYRVQDAWLVKFDLAGVRKEDIQVTLDANRLIVRGIRRDLTIVDGQRAYSMEIDYNQFERVVELPVNVETARFASDYRDGMFLVSITPPST